jgi:hypothetical protein
MPRRRERYWDDLSKREKRRTVPLAVIKEKLATERYRQYQLDDGVSVACRWSPPYRQMKLDQVDICNHQKDNDSLCPVITLYILLNVCFRKPHFSSTDFEQLRTEINRRESVFLTPVPSDQITTPPRTLQFSSCMNFTTRAIAVSATV